MSAFLGPVHHWLYNKIQWHENLLNKIYSDLLVDENTKKQLMDAMNTKYGESVTQPLENVIDESNIHGWLQERISILELKMADVISKGLSQNWISMDQLLELYELDGASAAKSKGESLSEADALFTQMNNFILDGMPCDRVNNPIGGDENSYQWERKTCIHAQYWEEVGGDISVFYQLRDSWLKGFSGDKIIYRKINDSVYEFAKA